MADYTLQSAAALPQPRSRPTLVHVLPTIDVEGVHGRRPFEQLVLGHDDHGEEWGTLRIARILREFGVTGTFFVDVFEHHYWGEASIRGVCERLLDLGQDVQLHTHPSWRDDPRDSAELRHLKRTRSFFPQHLDMMAKLSLSQQVEVLEHGIDCFRRWLGFAPTVHRSGGYSINEDTITALRRLGFAADSSMNVAHGNSRVTWSVNRVVRAQDGFLELPMTVFGEAVGIKSVSKVIRVSKTAVDWCSAGQLLDFVAAAKRMGLETMNLFMHSYPLLRHDHRYTRIYGDPAIERRLRRVLSALANDPEVRIVGCAEFARSPVLRSGPDLVPALLSNRPIALASVRKLRNVAATTARAVFQTWND